jgi:hypothetical protein
MSFPYFVAVNAGQSNTRTTDGQVTGDGNIPDGLWYFNNREQVNGTRWMPAKFGRYPLDKHDVRDRFNKPISLAFARRIIQQTGAEVYSMTVAKGAQPIESFLPRVIRRANTWPLPSGKTNLAPFLYSQIDDALDLVPGSPDYPDVFCWHQGEANNGDSQALLQAKIMAFHARLTLAGIIGPATKFICGGLLPVFSYYGVHKAASISACAALPNAIFVDSVGLTGLPDNVHFTGASLQAMGERYADAYLAAA